MKNFFADWLNKWAKYTPNRLMVRDGFTGEEWSYWEFNIKVNLLSKELVEKYNISKGDRIAVYSKNRTAYVALFFACIKIEAILVPVNFRLTFNEIEVILQDTEPSLLFYEDDFKDNIEKLIYISEKNLSINISEVDRISNSELTSTEINPRKLKAKSPVMILYTSGSTGVPKGAIITNKMLFWNSINTGLRLAITNNDHTLTFAPFYHTGGWNVLLTPFVHHGASQTVLNGFDADIILNLIEKEKVTLFFGVPTMLQMMAESPLFEKTDLSSMRYIVVGGSPMPIPLIEKYHTKGIAIRQGYGLTEVGPNCFSLSEEDAIRKIGSIGFPNFYFETRIIDETGKECEAEEPGELWLKSPVVTPGYWKNKNATKKAVTNGWFHTGDIVKKDEEGYYYVVDRKKNMFISGGENIYPSEIEKVLIANKSIKNAAVIGVEDAKWGEVGHAFIVADKEDQISKVEITEYCKRFLAKYKIPKHFTFLEELPLNSSSKIDKIRLLDIHKEQIQNNT